MKDQVVSHRQCPVQGVGLGYDAEPLLDRGRTRRDVDTGNFGDALGRFHPRRQHADGRGLPGAIGTEQAKEFTRRDLKINAVDRNDRTPRSVVHLAKTADADRCRAWWTSH